MLTLTGTIQNVFTSEQTTNRETGEVIPSADRVQLICENVMRNGERRIDLVNLKTEHGAALRKLLGRRVSIPVGAFSTGRAVQFYELRGYPEPQPLSDNIKPSGNAAAA